MEEENLKFIKEIENDPRLMLLVKSIFELSEQQTIHELSLKTIHGILIDQQKAINTLNTSIQNIGQAVDVIIKQMCTVSQHPSIPSVFKGIVIK